MSELSDARERLFSAVDAYKSKGGNVREWNELTEAAEAYALEARSVMSSQSDTDRLASILRGIGVMTDHAKRAAAQVCRQKDDADNRVTRLRTGMADAIGLPSESDLGASTAEAVGRLRRFAKSRWAKA